MSDIHIKASSPPKRCEICHQSDLFDEVSNVCSRCANVPLPTTRNTAAKPIGQNNQAPQKVFTSLLISLIVMSLMIFFLVAFVGNSFLLQLYYKFGLPTLVVPLVTALVGAYVFLDYVKLKMLEACPDSVSYIQTKPEAFPLLDLYTLDKYSESLISLGFQQVVDTTLQTQGGIVPPGFARVFLHPQHSSIAEVVQLFPADQPIAPMRVSFISHFENNWSYGSTDREPDAVSHIIRKPKGLGNNYANKNVSQIFQEHLEKRQTIAQNLNCPVLPIKSVEEHFSIECKNFKTTKPLVKSLFMPKAILKGLLFEYFPKYEWLGDYKRVISKEKFH